MMFLFDTLPADYSADDALHAVSLCRRADIDA